jgi:integrase/recombinase XerC
MQPHPVIQPFLDFIKFEKRYSRHTILAYQNDLVSFFDFLVMQYGETELSEITHTYIRSWLASLKDEEMKSKSINRKISSLRSFFRYQLKTGVIKKSPMLKVIAPKNEKRLPQFVADKDMATLFNHVEFPSNWQGATERLLILILYNTGMRLSELTGLKVNQVDTSNCSLKVLGKGNKERVIPVKEELLREISNYIAFRASQGFTDQENLLLSVKGRPLAPRQVYTIVKNYLSKVTTIEKRSPHVLRHSFATHLTNNGADLNAVKELLGHSSLASTQVYTHNTIEKLKNVYRQAHPKA